VQELQDKGRLTLAELYLLAKDTEGGEFLRKRIIQFVDSPDKWNMSIDDHSRYTNPACSAYYRYRLKHQQFYTVYDTETDEVLDKCIHDALNDSPDFTSWHCKPVEQFEYLVNKYCARELVKLWVSMPDWCKIKLATSLHVKMKNDKKAGKPRSNRMVVEWVAQHIALYPTLEAVKN
jgi:hypothetical protein